MGSSQRHHDILHDQHGPSADRLPQRPLDTVHPDLRRLPALLVPPPSSATPDADRRDIQTDPSTESETKGKRAARPIVVSPLLCTNRLQASSFASRSGQSSILLEIS